MMQITEQQTIQITQRTERESFPSARQPSVTVRSHRQEPQP